MVEDSGHVQGLRPLVAVSGLVEVHASFAWLCRPEVASKTPPDLHGAPLLRSCDSPVASDLFQSSFYNTD